MGTILQRFVPMDEVWPVVERVLEKVSRELEKDQVTREQWLPLLTLWRWVQLVDDRYCSHDGIWRIARRIQRHHQLHPELGWRITFLPLGTRHDTDIPIQFVVFTRKPKLPDESV